MQSRVNATFTAINPCRGGLIGPLICLFTAAMMFVMAVPAPLMAGGVLPLSEKDYLDRATAAIDAGLASSDVSLGKEFAELLEAGAYDDIPGVKATLTRRVGQLLTARLAHRESLSDGRGAELAELKSRIDRAAEAPARTAGKPRSIELPADEAGHKRLAEWWYMNGHLEDEEGNTYGYELTFFHVKPGIYFVHTGISDIAAQEFHGDRRYLRPRSCAISREKLDVAYGQDWSLTGTAETGYAIAAMTRDGSRLELNLRPMKQPMHVNGDGIIDMPEGTFSWYYSYTRLQTTGTLTLGDRTIPVKGLSWKDHQWGNFVCYRIGWDWFAVQLEDGTDYNIFSFRKGDSEPIRSHVNRLDSNATLSTEEGLGIERVKTWTSPASGHKYVTHYRLTLPGEVPLEIISEMDDQEMAGSRFDPAPTYWEGKCHAHRGGQKPMAGLSYCEQFPYPGK